MLDGRGRQTLLECAGKVLDDDDDLGTAVFKLVLQLARCVQRVDIDHHKTGTQYGRHRHRILGHVGHHDGNPVAPGQTQTLQVSGKSLAQCIGFPIAEVVPHKTVGDRPGMLMKALFHEIHQRAIQANVYVWWNTRWVTFKPFVLRHVFCLHPCLRTPTLLRTGDADCRVQPLCSKNIFDLNHHFTG